MRNVILSAALLGLLADLAALPADAAALRGLTCAGRSVWAVGDAGIILRSDDAGRTWRQVSYPVKANFQSLAFDGETVYVFGGQGIPGHNEGAAVAVLLRGDDGGESFERVSAAPAGRLYGGSFSGRAGVIFGQATAEAPHGLMRTLTGGQIWSQVPLSSTGWLAAGDFRTVRYGYLVGSKHRIASLRNMKEPAIRPPQIDSPLHLAAVRFADEQQCFCVGENGTVLRNGPSGRAWSGIPLKLPAGTRRLADFEAITFASPKRAWIAGGQ
ncbi:MAG: hypothetical protein KAU28_04210, partial [Phycisphaerae bacterium]|nr:hypothetical protein [Phycisphaerae bacterium]